MSSIKGAAANEIEQAPNGEAAGSEHLVFLFGAAALYLAAWFYADGLSFPIYEDENQFWKLTEDFAASYPPSIEAVRTYPEPMTPLSFLIFGFLEHLFHGGIQLGRHFNFLTSFLMLGVIASFHGGNRATALAATGLLLYPYFLPMGMHLYTDLPAAFFVLMAFRMQPRSTSRGLFLLLAVATRQYMFVFPVALIADECYRAYRTREWTRLAESWPDAIAAFSLIGWIIFFGGLGPDAGLTRWPRHIENLGSFRPMLGLHFLSTIGVYFVLPEFILYRRWSWLEQLRSRKSLIIGAILIILYCIDPPIFAGGILKQGFFGRTADYLPIPLRMCVFFLFAWIACVRFSRINLPIWILALQLVLVLNSFSAWEKYAFPVLAAFWMMKAMGQLDTEATRQASVRSLG